MKHHIMGGNRMHAIVMAVNICMGSFSVAPYYEALTFIYTSARWTAVTLCAADSLHQ